MPENKNSLSRFEQHIVELKPAMRRQYDRCVNKDLSQQKSQDLFRRNISIVLKTAFDDSLKLLNQMLFNAEIKENVPGLTQKILELFDGLTDEFTQHALHKHRTSCALSNFPDEHNPDKEYIARVTQETNTQWKTFSLQVKAIIGN